VLEVRYRCPKCGAQAAAPVTPPVGGAAPAAISATSADIVEHRCERCGDVRTLRFSESLRERGVADICALCGSEHFYVQKDFDQRIGCLVVAIGAAFVPWTYGLSLAVCALIDLVLYARLPNVAKCYVCKATYRGGVRNPAHEAFDLHRLEKYEAEARRKANEASHQENI
jgi:predicted RNA-binding Zn-ribbon protein involved in translation (DUF1610 family)